MLVLSRKENESITIDGNIEITIVNCGRGQVKLGINAPKHISILRGELKSRESETTQPASTLGTDVNTIPTSFRFSTEAIPAGV